MSYGNKPVSGATIVSGHAWTTGLTLCMTFSEGSGTSFRDAALNSNISSVTNSSTPGGATDPTWISAGNGGDFPWGGNNSAISNNAGSVKCIKGADVSTFWVGHLPSAVYVYAALIRPQEASTLGRIMDASGPGVLAIYSNIPGHLGEFSATFRNSSNIAINPLSGTFTTNTWYLWMLVVQQGSGKGYLNGTQVYTNATVDFVKSDSGGSYTSNFCYNTSGLGQAPLLGDIAGIWVWKDPDTSLYTGSGPTDFYNSPWAMFFSSVSTLPLLGVG